MRYPLFILYLVYITNKYLFTASMTYMQSHLNSRTSKNEKNDNNLQFAKPTKIPCHSDGGWEEREMEGRRECISVCVCLQGKEGCQVQG